MKSFKSLRPFWRYYGGKWRAAPRYPKPQHDTIIEPFAGSAGYSLRYPDRDVILADTYSPVAEIWKFLIGACEDDITSIPNVESLDELPSWVPIGAKYLVGFCFMDAAVRPANRLSAGRKKLTSMGRHYEGWCDNRKRLIAGQLSSISHWCFIDGSYKDIPDLEGTWFIDPPYNNKQGRCYVHSEIDYRHLAIWCCEREGQAIVCENEGADWLPFEEFATLKAGISGAGYGKGVGQGSKEVIFTF